MNKKFIFGIIVLIILMFVIRAFTYMNSDDRIRRNVISLGFSAYEDEIGYYKQLSDIDLEQYYVDIESKDSYYDALFFNTSTYEFMENKFQKINGVEINFIPVYDYKTMELSYTYRLVYETSNLIFEGKYDINTGEFTCDKSYAHDIEIFDSEDIVCENAKNSIKDFVIQIDNFITNPNLIKYMNNSKE